MIVYVAGASAELLRARRAMEWLTAAGFEVAVDWTVPVEQHCSAPNDADARREYALADEAGVDRADLLWLLVPHAATKGAWWEASRARAIEMRVIASGAEDDLAGMIFVELADERFADAVDMECSAYRSTMNNAARTQHDVDRANRSYAAAQDRADERAGSWLRGFAAARGAL